MTIEIEHTGSTEELAAILRRGGTVGQPDLQPYVEASISLEEIDIDQLIPLSKYLLEEQLGLLTSLQSELRAQGGDLFSLEGRLTWSDAGRTKSIAPPVVEVWEGEGHLLVDGLHRVWLARTQGRCSITCVMLRGVTVPLVPLSASWEDIRVFPEGERPTEAQKRNYRFADPEAVRNVRDVIRDGVTEDNFRYYLFRDLNALGSSGIRATEK